jgi:hypothetical protein
VTSPNALTSPFVLDDQHRDRRASMRLNPFNKTNDMGNGNGNVTGNGGDSPVSPIGSTMSPSRFGATSSGTPINGQALARTVATTAITLPPSASAASATAPSLPLAASQAHVGLRLSSTSPVYTVRPRVGSNADNGTSSDISMTGNGMGDDERIKHVLAEADSIVELYIAVGAPFCINIR